MSILKWNRLISRYLMVAAASWAFALCFLIVGDVIGRGAFNTPIQGTKEIVANSIVMIVFLQASYAIRSGSMLRADFLVSMFNPRFRKIILTFGYLIGAALFLIMVSGGIEPAVHSWVSGEYEGEGALRVPAWPTRIMILICGSYAVFNYGVLVVTELFLSEKEPPEPETPVM